MGTPLFTKLSDGSGSLDTRNVNSDAQAFGVNPMLSTLGLAHGYNGSSWDRLRTINTGQLKSTLYDVSGNVQFPPATNLQEGAANPNTPMIGGAGLLWNGVTWDRAINKKTASLVTRTGATSSYGSSAIKTYNATGLILYIEVTSYPATPAGITPFLNCINPDGVGYRLWTAAAALTVDLNPMYITGIGITTPGGTTFVKETFKVPLPDQITIGVTHGDAKSYSYKISYELIGVS